METRARRQSLRAATSAVPSELWLLILGLLDPKDAIAASCVCSEFRHVAPASAKRAIQRLWPHHSARVAAKIGATGVQKLLALIAQHESEAKGHPDVQKAIQVQKLVLPEHRQIAVEWLIEVAWDWQLESTVVYRGAQYLDHYLSSYPVPALSKFQMLAISSLRTALKHSSKLAERERARLPYKHWAEVTDGACTEAEVRSTCSKLERLLGPAQRGHPNAKQRLRYLWYRLYDAGVVKQEHVYAYMLASFMLHLSLLDSGLAAATPTLLAVSALSLSLDVFGFAPCPAALQEHCLYSQQELQEVQQKLRTAQEELPAKQLRALWVHSYSYIGTNPLQQPAYSHLQLIVSSRGRLQQLQQLLSGVASRTGSNSVSNGHAIAAAAAAALASAAAAVALDAVGVAAAAGMPPAAAAAAASAGPVDATVIVGVVPAAAAAGAAAAAPAAGMQLPPAPVGRVVTRAAAAAGQQQRQHLQQRHNQQQQQQGVHTRYGAATCTRHAASPPASISVPNNQQQQHSVALLDRLLPTPQRTSLTPLSAVAAAEQQAARHPHHAAGAACLMAGLGGNSNAQQHADGSSSAAAAATGALPRRCLRVRKAVASSRYGCRGAGGAAAAAGSSGAASSSAAAVAAASCYGPQSFWPPANATAGSFLSGSTFAAAAAAAGAAAPAGSTTPASPKHSAAAAGQRGLAALFADATCATASRGSSGGSTSSRSTTSEALQLQWSLESDDLERRHLIEGTPQPPQLLLALQQQQRRASGGDAAARKHGLVGRAAATAAEASEVTAMDVGLHWAGSSSGSHMLAACQAAASAAAAAAAAAQGN